MLDAYYIDYQWDEKIYFNYRDLYEKLPVVLKAKYTLLPAPENSAISIYDADACAGIKIYLRQFDTLPQFMHFMYYYCNLFNDLAKNQYLTHQILPNVEKKTWVSFGYFGFFRLTGNGSVNVTSKEIRIIAKEIDEKHFLKTIPERDVLIREIASFINKHPELKMKIVN